MAARIRIAVWLTILPFLRGLEIFHTIQIPVQIFSGTLVIISTICYVTAIIFEPLADAVAVTFVAQFFVIIMASLFEKKK